MSVEQETQSSADRRRGPLPWLHPPVRVVWALVLVGAVAPPVAISYGCWQLYRTAARLATGSPMGAYETSLSSITTLAAVVGGALVLQAGVGLAFLAWLYQARKGSERLSRAAHRYGRGWAIGAWFVPVVNLLLPPLIVTDVLQASSTEAAPRTRSVTAWWIATLLARLTHVAAWVNLGVTLAGGLSPSSLLAVAVIHTAGTLCSLVAGLLLGTIIIAVSDGQRRMAARVPEQAGDESDDGAAEPLASHRSVTPDVLAPEGIGRWFSSAFSLIRRSAAPLIVLAAVAAAADAVDLLNWMTIEPTGDGLWFGSTGIGIGGARGTLTGDGDWATKLYSLFAHIVRATFYSAAIVVVVRLASGDVTSVLVGLRVAVLRLLPLLGWLLATMAIFMVGLLLLVVPGVYVLIVTVPLIAVVTLEKRGIRRCFELVRGRFWPTAARFVLTMTIPQLWWLLAYGLSFQIVEQPAVSAPLYTVLAVPGYVITAGFFAATYVELKFHDDLRQGSVRHPDEASGPALAGVSSPKNGGELEAPTAPDGVVEKQADVSTAQSQDIVPMEDDSPADPDGRSADVAIVLAIVGAAIVLIALTAFVTVGLMRYPSDRPAADQATTDPSPSAISTSNPPVKPTATDLIAAMLAQTRRDGSGTFHVSSPGIENFDSESDGWFIYEGDAVSVGTNEIYLGYPTASVVLDGRSWVKIPDPSTLPPGKSWIECPPIGSGDPGRDLPYRYCTMTWWAREYADPAGLLSRAGASVTLVNSIPETLGATPATRHQLRIDWAEAATLQTDPEWRAWFELRAEMKGVETINLWVDSQSRPLQRTAEQDLELANAVGAVTYGDWGRRPSIAPPSSDQIA
jgi:hypothetical protein